MTRVSVALAVYNGGKYLNEQLGSIINQLTTEDELVMSDNMSTDDSRDIILSYVKLYPNIVKVSECQEPGIVANFENAINHCTGEYIFLADQDDVWNQDKIIRMLQEFEATDADLILHDCDYVDENLVSLNKTLFTDLKVKEGFKKNLWKNSYLGCCMAFKSSLVKIICPFPRDIFHYDQWIGLISEKTAIVDLMEEKLIQHRKYKGSNSTKHVSLQRKLHYVKHMKKEIAQRISSL